MIFDNLPSSLFLSPLFLSFLPFSTHPHISTIAMSSSEAKETIQEFIEAPKTFMKEGVQFINRCKKPDQKGKRTRCVY
jgi:hypothetical protein